MGEYGPALVPGLVQRSDIKALEIVQPEGPSFTLDGNELRWQNWSMRLGFNHREGLVIHRVGYRTTASEHRGPSPTGCPSPRWSSPTATRAPTTTGGPRSTSASGAWAS